MKYILKITFKTITKFDTLKKNLTFIKKIGNFKKINIKGIYKIKNKKKILTLLKSPHIYKKAREHFIYKEFIIKIEIIFNNFINLINYLIFLKKILGKNKKINIKISKNAYNLNG
jgi:ribosomal protein S10